PSVRKANLCPILNWPCGNWKAPPRRSPPFQPTISPKRRRPWTAGTGPSPIYRPWRELRWRFQSRRASSSSAGCGRRRKQANGPRSVFGLPATPPLSSGISGAASIGLSARIAVETRGPSTAGPREGVLQDHVLVEVGANRLFQELLQRIAGIGVDEGIFHEIPIELIALVVGRNPDLAHRR